MDECVGIAADGFWNTSAAGALARGMWITDSNSQQFQDRVRTLRRQQCVTENAKRLIKLRIGSFPFASESEAFEFLRKVCFIFRYMLDAN